MKMAIPYPSAQAKKILWDATLAQDSTTYRAVPSQLTENKLIINLLREDELHRPHWLKRWAAALRAISLTSMFIPTLSTYLLLTQNEFGFNIHLAISAIIIPCLLLLAVNVLNDVEDHLKLIDMPGTIGGSGVIQKGWLTPKQLTVFAFLSILTALTLSVPFLIKIPILRWMIAPFTLMVVVGYSGKPFSFKYRALGDLMVFLCCGPLLTTAFSLAVFGTYGPSVLLIGSFYGLLACTILHANNMNDINNDTQRGGKTLASLVGFENSKLLMTVYYLAAFVSLLILVVMQELSWWQISPLFLVSFPIGKLMRSIFKASHPEDQSIANIRFITPQIHLLTGIILCLSISFIKGS